MPDRGFSRSCFEIEVRRRASWALWECESSWGRVYTSSITLQNRLGEDSWSTNGPAGSRVQFAPPHSPASPRPARPYSTPVCPTPCCSVSLRSDSQISTPPSAVPPRPSCFAVQPSTSGLVCPNISMVRSQLLPAPCSEQMVSPPS